MPANLLASAQAVKDSRGALTLKISLAMGKLVAHAMVPSGRSTGSREAKELRDEGARAMSSAILGVNTEIAKLLKRMPFDPIEIDEALIELDGTKDKSRLGANALIGVSMALRRLAAAKEGIPLWKYIAKESRSAPAYPKLYVNMLNGGAHADFRLPFQEYIVVVGGRTPSESYRKVQAIFGALGTEMRKRYGTVPMGDEGGYSPALSGVEKPLEVLARVTEDEAEVFLALDVAASQFYRSGKYFVGSAPLSRDEFLSLLADLAKKFKIRSIEDPFEENDHAGFAMAMKKLGGKALIVGDDLTVTNPAIVRECIAGGLANALLVKPNQVGTLWEVYEACAAARKAGWKLIVSHRSGETTDDFIADLAVGLGAYGLKAGAPSQAERRAKYERLVAIESEMR